MIQLWQNFPWDNIYIRLLSIQRKIFKASKAYDKISVYKLQKYLLNSIEAKIFAVEYIIKKSNILSYLNISLQIQKKRKFLIESNYKFIILRFLCIHQTYLSSNLSLILEKIKQYILYLCIKPEWEARLDKKSLISNKFVNNDFDLHLFLYNKTYQFQVILIDKIQSFKYIYQCFKYWYNNKYLINLNYRMINSINCTKFMIYTLNDLNLINDKLSMLFYQIYINDTYWYNFYISSINSIDFCKHDNKILDQKYKLYNKIHLADIFMIDKYNIDVAVSKFSVYQIIRYSYIHNLNNCIDYIYTDINNQVFYYLKKNNRYFSKFFISRLKNFNLNLYIHKIMYYKNYLNIMNR